MTPRTVSLSRRRLEARHLADDVSRDAIGRAFPDRRGLPRVCGTCGRVNDLLHRVTGHRQSVYAVLFRFFDWMHGHGARFEELLPMAEVVVWYLYDLYDRAPGPPHPVAARESRTARAERMTATGTYLRAA